MIKLLPTLALVVTLANVAEAKRVSIPGYSQDFPENCRGRVTDDSIHRFCEWGPATSEYRIGGTFILSIDAAPRDLLAHLQQHQPDKARLARRGSFRACGQEQERLTVNDADNASGGYKVYFSVTCRGRSFGGIASLNNVNDAANRKRFETFFARAVAGFR
jgi:hypothetical protein